jgi:hypothetical protein
MVNKLGFAAAYPAADEASGEEKDTTADLVSKSDAAGDFVDTPARGHA